MTPDDPHARNVVAGAVMDATGEWVRLSLRYRIAEKVLEALAPIVASEVRKAKAEALREAARYFAGGLHCAGMRTTPEETVRDLNRRAAEYETGDSDEHR